MYIKNHEKYLYMKKNRLPHLRCQARTDLLDTF